MGNSIKHTYKTFNYSPIKIISCQNAVKFYNELYDTDGLDDPHIWRWSRTECVTDLVKALLSMIAMLISICLLIHQTKIKKYKCFRKMK